MINAAHIGIGISGLEGQQAAKASDYAIGKFKFLKDLLFVHGRENYRRNSFAICYIFYKNILLTAPLFLYGFWSSFSGTLIYNLLLYQGFNTVFTTVPIIWFSTMDYQYSKDILLFDPNHYKGGLYNVHFNKQTFIRWLIFAFVQSWVLVYITTRELRLQSKAIDGKMADYS